jgi:putative oxidoreductase
MLKRLLFGSLPFPSSTAELALLVPRVFAGLAMSLAHGKGKFPPSEKFVSGVAEMGFPAPELFAWMASSAEFLGGLGLAFGFLTRLSSFGIFSTMCVAAFVRHAADPFNNKELSLLYLSIAVAFMVLGGGRYSIDRFFRGATAAPAAGAAAKKKKK